MAALTGLSFHHTFQPRQSNRSWSCWARWPGSRRSCRRSAKPSGHQTSGWHRSASAGSPLDRRHADRTYGPRRGEHPVHVEPASNRWRRANNAARESADTAANVVCANLDLSGQPAGGHGSPGRMQEAVWDCRAQSRPYSFPGLDLGPSAGHVRQPVGEHGPFPPDCSQNAVVSSRLLKKSTAVYLLRFDDLRSSLDQIRPDRPMERRRRCPSETGRLSAAC